jgi:hypothetical protein
MTDEIDTGDTVEHGPTGETWIVAYVEKRPGSSYGDVLCAVGWPNTEARLRDCALVQKATPEYRDQLLHQLANMHLENGQYDRRRALARTRLGLEGP